MSKESSMKKFKRMKYLNYLVVILMGLLILSGCGVLETLVKEEGEPTPLGEWVGTAGDEENIPAVSNLGDGRKVSLYFPDKTGTSLVKEERDIPKTLSLARETVKQWLTGPAVSGTAQHAVNPATTLLDIGIKEGVATVDLSREFTEPINKVSQEIAVYGLVNTLTQFPTVQEVKLRIEGRELAQLGGVDLSDLSYREGLVKGLAGNEAAQSNSSVTEQPSTEEQTPEGSPSSLNLFAPTAT